MRSYIRPMLAALLRLFCIRKPSTAPETQVAESAPGGLEPAELMTLIQSGRVEQAELGLRERLTRFPADADTLHLLGLACLQTERISEAVALMQMAVKSAPEAAFVHANLSVALRRHGELGTAIEHARVAVRLEPGHSDFQLILAAVSADLGLWAEAANAASQVLATQPERLDALTLSAEALFRLDRSAEAIAAATAALRLLPHDPGLLSSLMRQKAWVCDWRNRTADVAAFTSIVDEASRRQNSREGTQEEEQGLDRLNPFVCYEYGLHPQLCAAVTRLHARSCSRLAGNAPDASKGRATTMSARLRIGYVSADFHRHPTMHLMANFFGLHDRRRFEVTAYSIGADDGSEYRRRARESVDHFVDIRGESASVSAERIARDGMDILVDLKGFTHEARPAIFALRPAPLRVAWLGYPASTDNRLNDYAIVDHVTVPHGHDAQWSEPQWSEKLVRMPHSYQVNDYLQPVAPAAPERSELGLPDSGFVYACFNQIYKIEPEVFGLWMRILKRVPGSVLWLYTGNSMARSNLAREAQAHGVSPARLVFGETLDKPRHLARLARADLFLDTGTINAHTSASDALWAGLPVLTRPGDRFAARVGASLVTAAGLPQLVCESFAQYEETAVRLASAPAEMADMRRVLQAQGQLPLFDTPRFTRNLERAFEMMWARYSTGLPPQSFDVPDVDSGAMPPASPGHM